MQVDSTFSPTHTHTHLWERRKSMTPIPIYASAVIIVYAKSLCHTLPLQCPSSLSIARIRTHMHTLESQWFPFVRASCQRELCGLLLKQRTAEAEKFISNCGKKKSLFRKVTLYLQCFKNSSM